MNHHTMDPGACPGCGARLVATVSVDLDGETLSSVGCLRCSRYPPPGRPLAVTLDVAGDYRVHVEPGPVPEVCAQGLSRAVVLLSRVLHRRRTAAARSLLGPWRVEADGDQVFAPRPPGRVKGERWPLRQSVLRASKYLRRCVGCEQALDPGQDVWRADARAVEPNDRWALGWSSNDVRDCIVCEACVADARARSAEASKIAAGILADLTGNL